MPPKTLMGVEDDWIVEVSEYPVGGGAGQRGNNRGHGLEGSFLSLAPPFFLCLLAAMG